MKSSELAAAAAVAVLALPPAFVHAGATLRHMNLPLIRSLESESTSRANSARPGWESYQRYPAPTGPVSWVTDKLKVGLWGVEHFGEETLAAGKTTAKRLVAGRKGGATPPSLSEQLRTSRAGSDFARVGTVVGFKVFLKQDLLSFCYFFPRQILPSVFFSEKNDHDLFRRRCRQRVTSGANLLVKMETMVSNDDHPHERDLYRPYADLAAEILAAPSPAAALACLGTTTSTTTYATAEASAKTKKSAASKKKNKKKKKKKAPPPLKGLPPALVKGFTQAVCDLPLGLAGWAPAFFLRPIASGVMRDLERSDEVLRAAQLRGEDLAGQLSRRDLLNLAAARGFGHAAASDASLAKDLEAWLEAVYSPTGVPAAAAAAAAAAADDDDDDDDFDDGLIGFGWAEDPVRRRAVLVGLNALESVRRHPTTAPQRALFGGGELSGPPGGVFIGHPLTDSYDAPLASLSSASAFSSPSFSATAGGATAVAASPPPSGGASSRGGLAPLNAALLSSVAFTSGFALSKFAASGNVGGGGASAEEKTTSPPAPTAPAESAEPAEPATEE